MRKTFQLLFAATIIFVFGASHVVGAQSEPKRVDVVAKRFSFEPSEITLKKGQPVLLVLKNADTAHGLRFRELNVDVRAAAGGTGQVEFTPDKVGDFIGHCSVFCGSGHGSMSLTLHVVE